MAGGVIAVRAPGPPPEIKTAHFTHHGAAHRPGVGVIRSGGRLGFLTPALSRRERGRQIVLSLLGLRLTRGYYPYSPPRALGARTSRAQARQFSWKAVSSGSGSSNRPSTSADRSSGKARLNGFG